MAQSLQSDVEVSVITSASDIPAAFGVAWACFGEQTRDQIFRALNLGYDTPDGYDRAVQRMTQSFEKDAANNRDKHGNPTQIYLKATTTTTTTTNERIVGFATWIQLSAVEGHGEPLLLDASKDSGAEILYPDDESEQKYLSVLFENLYRSRHELAQQRSQASPLLPAIMALDICVVHPDFQGRGIASRLVRYGLDEARRRGGLVCCTEASRMGRSVYARLGFVQRHEIEYGAVEGAKFAREGLPSNFFMSTESESDPEVD